MENKLARKLLIKAGFQVLIINSPEGFAESLQPLPVETALHFVPQNTYHVVLLFVKNSSELARDLSWLTTHLSTDTVFWIAYPKKKSGIETDLGMMLSWDETSKHGLEPVASAAINETWTALRFKPKDLIKRTEVRNASIGTNEFGEYIDVENKRVSLPADVKTALEEKPAALNYFYTLSYSHKKEYVLWILTAKQEKTRTDRIAKMVEKLLAGKKNPAAK